MKRWYLFLLEESWRTRDIEAYTLQQAYRIARKEYGDQVYSTYQTCPLSGSVFSGWKNMKEGRAKTMSLRDFIKQNRKKLDGAIRQVCPSIQRLTDQDRRAWILSDEDLYKWAQAERVRA